ncbi:sporulation protein [Pseudoduganella sp. FT25W]|uniref:Sporulation protein n=2 Tax=Duganella alba TaxID=2666081 RepID=A0A6L5QFI4_9BURK|nr:sporulation protein [Duganella alba]MRX16909.1 sporulation protein [Duganella alba]
MGLFSKSGKNKQDTAGQDSGYYTSADDQAMTERARSKRASSSDGPKRRSRDREEDDPVLPEKKRARRRLVGAIMLALGVAVGLPMLLDSEPKPLSTDIEIKIPSKDKPSADIAPAPAAAVPPSAALDSKEEIVDDVKPAPAAKPSPAAAAVDTTKADEAKAKAEARAEAQAKAQADRELKARQDADYKQEQERKLAEAKAEAKLKEKQDAERKLAEAKAAKPAETKPAKADTKSEDARALAILEGKGAAPAAADGQKFVLQVAALSDQAKADELRTKLKNAGISSFTQKTASGITRVRVGPFSSKEEAEKVKAKLSSMGLEGRLETV